MCDPVTIGTTLAVASTGMQYQQARTEQKFQQYRYDQNKVNSEKAYEATTAQNQLATNQTIAENVNAQQQNKLQADKARATASVSGAEAGVQGISLDSLIADYSRQEATNSNQLQTNLDNQLMGLGQEYENAGLQKQSRIQSVQKGRKVNPLPYLLKIGTDVAGGMQ